jgi:hypothetical protein
MQRKIFWTVFMLLGLLADVLLPFWWACAAASRFAPGYFEVGGGKKLKKLEASSYELAFFFRA